MPDRDRVIRSMRELQRLAPQILKDINADDGLALRAAVNPLLAVEELGYQLAPEVRVEAERRIRFSADARKRIEALEKEIFTAAGGPFDIGSSDEVERVLYQKLKLPRADATTRDRRQEGPAAALSPGSSGARPAMFHFSFADPLAGLAGAHPIMKALLEYRQLDASAPRLAPVDLYERVRRGEVALPVTRVRGRLKAEPAPE